VPAQVVDDVGQRQVNLLRRVAGVHQYDVAPEHVFPHALDHEVGPRVFPVNRVQRPNDRLVAQLAGGGHHQVVVVAVGRAEKARRAAGGFLQVPVGGHDVLDDVVGAVAAEIDVRVAVAGDLVPVGHDAPGDVRVALGPETAEEKRGFDVLFPQNVQHRADGGRAPADVEGE